MTRRCLIVAGGYPGHEPEETSARLVSLLEPENFSVDVSRDLAIFANGDLEAYDLIVPNWTNGVIEPDTATRLQNAVRAGVGLGGFHGGMGDGFRENVRFQFLVGGQFVGHPGNIRDYRVEITKSDDPIVAGLPDFDYRSEQYYLHTDPTNEVLAETRFDGSVFPWLEGVRMAVCWKRLFGSGRVFYSALGHVAAEFDVEPMRVMLLRGLLWASRRRDG